MRSIINCMDGSRFSSQGCCQLYSVKKMQGWSFANTLTFAFMHHLYLVCILFGMPSLHLTFLMFFFFFFFFSRFNRNHTPSRNKLVTEQPSLSYHLITSQWHNGQWKNLMSFCRNVRCGYVTMGVTWRLLPIMA